MDEYQRLLWILRNPKSSGQLKFAKQKLAHVYGMDFDNDPYLGTDLSFTEPKK